MRLPPQNQEAEIGVLAACIANAHDCSELRDMLAAEDFYFDAHQEIFRAVCSMRDKGKAVDRLTIADELKRCDKFANVGGAEYLDRVIGSSGAAYAQHYAKIVQQTYVSRMIAVHASQASEDAANQNAPAEDILERTMQELSGLSSKLIGESDNVEIASAVNSLLDSMDRAKRGEVASATETGFSSLDAILNGGLRPGHLAVLAARPSVGKTALAVNIARNVCSRGGSVLFISLEQSSEELTSRLIAGVANVFGSLILSGKLREESLLKVSKAANTLRSWKMCIRDRPGMTTSQIASAARLAKRRYSGLDLIVVDYLNEIRQEESTDTKKTNRNEILGAACRRLRECAKSLSVPCLLLAQLNRDVAKENQVPALHHLRDSGEIEQIADVVALLHRDKHGDKNSPDELRILVAKQRNGKLGEIHIVHEAPKFIMREVDYA